MKNLKNALVNLYKKLWANGGNHVFHTFWQVAGGVLLAQLTVAHSAKDVYAAVVVAGAAGFAAVKATYLAKR